MKETKRTEEKNNGRYYTPIDMVCFILNTANYCGNNILKNTLLITVAETVHFYAKLFAVIVKLHLKKDTVHNN